MTPDEGYDLSAKPENQVPQGARGAGGLADVAHTGAVPTRVAQRDLSPGGADDDRSVSLWIRQAVEIVYRQPV